MWPAASGKERERREGRRRYLAVRCAVQSFGFGGWLNIWLVAWLVGWLLGWGGRTDGRPVVGTSVGPSLGLAL